LVNKTVLFSWRESGAQTPRCLLKLDSLYSFCPRAERALHSQRGARRIAALKYKLAAGKNTLAVCEPFAFSRTCWNLHLYLHALHVLGICFFVVLMCGGECERETGVSLNNEIDCRSLEPLARCIVFDKEITLSQISAV